MKNRKGILLISIAFTPNLGGAETHLNDLCEYLRKKFFVYVLTYQPIGSKLKGQAFEKRGNLEIRRFNLVPQGWFDKLEPFPILEFFYLFPGLFFGTLFFMVRHHSKIDAIHAHGFIAALVTRLVTLFYPKTTTMSTHAIYEFKKRGLMGKIARWILSGFDTVMPLALESKKDLIVAGVPERKIKIYTQWVDQNLFKPRPKDASRERLHLKGKFIVLFVGRFIAKKGMAVLIEVARKMPSVDFVLIGDGPEYQNIEKMSTILKNVYLPGRKDQKLIALYYNSADLVAIPSQYEEGFARVVLEGLSSGRPIIAANKGCLPEMISQDVGVLVDPTPENIGNKIKYFLENPQKLEQMTKRTRAYAKKYFSEKNVEKIAQTYFVTKSLD